MSVIEPLPVSKKEIECTCAACKQFFRHVDSGGPRIRKSQVDRADDTAVLGGDKGPLRKGDRVIVQGKHTGVIQYIGIADDHLVAPESHIGVHTHENVYSVHNGMYKGKRFFHTPRGHAMMVKYSEVRPLHPIEKTRELSGNPMFPSYQAVHQRRKARQNKIKEEEDRIKAEFETKRKAQMDRFAKSAPPPRISPRPNRALLYRHGQVEDRPALPIQDDNDVAYQDYLKQRCKKQQQQFLASLVDHEDARLQRMKKMFGGDEKADRLAATLNKLHHAYEEGRIVAMADRDRQ